jgi:hypothetical protein
VVQPGSIDTGKIILIDRSQIDVLNFRAESLRS